MRTLFAAFAVAAASVSAVRAADTPSLTVGLRLQGWYVAEQHGAPDGGTAQDFLLRRGYLSLNGKLTPDRAYGTESTFTLLALDLPQTQGGGRGAIFYPSKVGRDDGVVAWGGLWRGRIQYRAGVMEGVEGQANPGDSLRFAGRVSLSLLDPETGWFNRGTYLGEKRVLALSVGFDRQADLTIAEEGGRTYRAWTADLFLDRPVGRGAVTVEASYTDAHALPLGLPFAGVPAGADSRMAYVQGGFLLPWCLGGGRLQVYGRAERTLVSDGDDTSLPGAGLNYLVRGQDLKVTADWSRSPRGARPASTAITLQTQVGF